MKRLVLTLAISLAFAFGGVAQQGDLIFNPDTLWFYHNGDIEYFTITNEYNYPVQIDSMGDYGGYLWPGYDLPDLPYTIEPGESVSFNFRFTYPVKDKQDLREYVTTSVSIFTSVGQRELPVMIDQAGMVNLLFLREMYFDNPSDVVQTMIMNKSWYIPTIHVYSIAEKNTDYLNIEIEPMAPPFDLTMDFTPDMTVTLKDLVRGYVETAIEIETDYGTFEIAVYINEEIITINGILTQVEAPYFEQNASDNRLAIVTGEETYYTTVNGYWPNPDGDALIVGFDTIPMGSQIEVGGTYSLMEDDNGDNFKVFDIKRLAHPTYTSALGYLSQFAIFAGPQYIYAWSVYDQKTLHGNYFLTVNGALQTELPVLPDGIMLTDSIRYIVVGIADTIHDYYGNPINVLELTNIFPYEPNFTANGLLSLQGDLCLSTPCGETAYLSLDEGTDRHYLTLVGEMRHNYINDSIFSEGVQAQINGLEATHYDLFGAPFQTLDILEMEAAVEQTLVGPVVSTGNPNIGPFPPLGMELAFYHNGIEYYFSPYIEEIYYPLGGTNYQYILLYELDNDTLVVGKEVTAQFTTSTMRIDNYLKPNYRVTLNHAEYYDHLEKLHGRLAIVDEPYNTMMYAIITDDDERYLIEPYFVNYAEYDELVFGEDTIAVGDSFTATGEVFNYYDDSYEDFYFNGINILEINEIDAPFIIGNEWYYEIQNDDGSITYQYLYQAGDTIVQDEPTHILVKINTLYDKDLHQDVTHEYVYERDGKVYWWNKTLEEFTVLYDFGAQEGDSWTIKVGTETLIMHVNSVETFEYEGKTYRMLHVSDADDYFSGDIVCGIGHLTSFFPERLMDNGDGLRVEGLRCYWIEDELVFKPGDEDCDAIYDELHGIEEPTYEQVVAPFDLYPNPTDGVLFVETRHGTSLPVANEYRIANLMGQTLMTGQITADNQQINVSSLPQGMYFITFAGETQKFVVR
ncbi:MAG: T9SS type A sorting domain-containing protein [bacterium]|nr:T9SS type A sorting domain-containing protein [bacterium]